MTASTASAIRTAPTTARPSGGGRPRGSAISCESALYANLVTAQAIAPFMVAAGAGLIVVTTFDAEGAYLGDAFHDLAMASTARLARVMAADLAPHGVTALALSPGLVRTERAVAAGLGGEASESPLYAGRVLAALAADPEVARFAGQVLHVADLARLYGVKDVDGRQPGALQAAQQSGRKSMTRQGRNDLARGRRRGDRDHEAGQEERADGRDV